jgi:hypothetical protein
LTGVWKRLTGIFQMISPAEDFCGEATAGVLGLARELEVGPEEAGELLPSAVTLMEKEVLLLGEQRRWFLEMGSTPGEDVCTLLR